MTPADVWHAFGELTLPFYASGPDADPTRGDGWYAALSRAPSAELNVCCLVPGTQDVAGLLALLGDDLPVIVFSPESSHGARAVLAGAGFEIAGTPEPLMRAGARPAAHVSTFSVRRGESDADIGTAVALTSSAHVVDASLLEATLATAARAGAATVWLAFNGDEPISTVWLRRDGSTLGVMEMMTPPQHQGRGAGRALLTAALAAEWDDHVDQAVLLATPAGRRLYEAIGFVPVDESVTCYRGLADEILAAIGQPG